MSRRIGVDLSSTRAVLANVSETRSGLQLHGFAFVEAEGALDVIAADLREARQTYRLPRASEVVAWPGDQRIDAVKQAGFRIERVITPGEALARVARLHYHGQPMSGVLAVVSLHPSSGAVAVVRDGRLLFETELAWNAAAPVSGADSELLRRYTFVSELTESLRRVFETVRTRQGVNVTEILTCGSLTDLRSLTMPLAAEFDVEVETLDLTDDVEIRVRDASPEQMRDTIASLRLAIAAGKRWHKRTLKEVTGRLRVPRVSLATRAAALAAACVLLVFVWVRYERPATTTPVPTASRTTARTTSATRPPTTVPPARGTRARVAPPTPPLTARPLRVSARLQPVPVGIPHASLMLALAKAEQDIAVSASGQPRAQTPPAAQNARGAPPPLATTKTAAMPAQRVAAAPAAAPHVAGGPTPAPAPSKATQKPALNAAATVPPPVPKAASRIASAPTPAPTAAQKPTLNAAATVPPPVSKTASRTAAALAPAPVPPKTAQSTSLNVAANAPPPVAKTAPRLAAAAPAAPIASPVSKSAARVATQTRPAAIAPAVPNPGPHVATSTPAAVPPPVNPKPSSRVAAAAPAPPPATKLASSPAATTPRSGTSAVASKAQANAPANVSADAALAAPHSPAATAWSPRSGVVKPPPDPIGQPMTSAAGRATQPRVAAKSIRGVLPAPADVVVTSILWSDDRQLAIVNSRIVGEGDVVGTQTVVEIEADAVVFRDPAGRLRRASLRQGL